MADKEVHPALASSGVPPSRKSSPDPEPLLSALIDLDIEYERERLSESLADSKRRIAALETLRQQYRERRQPYLDQLALLQEHSQDL